MNSKVSAPIEVIQLLSEMNKDETKYAFAIPSQDGLEILTNTERGRIVYDCYDGFLVEAGIAFNQITDDQDKKLQAVSVSWIARILSEHPEIDKIFFGSKSLNGYAVIDSQDLKKQIKIEAHKHLEFIGIAKWSMAHEKGEEVYIGRLPI